MQRLFLIIAKTGARILYVVLKLFPIKDKIVLISRFNSYKSLDFMLLEKEIKRVSPNTKIVILNHKLKNKFYLIFDVIKEMKELATSKAAIVDSYIIPVSILKHKKELTIIQIWHSLGAIKKFGYAALDTKEGAKKNVAKTMGMHKNYDYVIAGGGKTRMYYSEAFNIPVHKILPYSLPRIDYLVNKEIKNAKRKEIFEKYPELKQKKNIFYFPTFRKGTKIPYQNLIEEVDFKKYNLVIQPHKLDKTPWPKDDRIIITKGFDFIDLLFIADYVISDYSGIIFEAAVVDIPIYCYLFDYKDYKQTRGLFMDMMKEFPQISSINAKDIIRKINEEKFTKKDFIKFKEKYISVTNGTSTRKIVELLNLKGV